MSKYQKHYLSDDKHNKLCPLQQESIQCDSYCAWFDHVHYDCRMIGGFWKVREGLTDITELLTDLREMLINDEKRKFKF